MSDPKEYEMNPEFGNGLEDIFDNPEDLDIEGEEEEDLAEVEELSSEQKILALETDLGKAKDQMMRLAAELENTRRRAQREKADAARYGVSNFARDLLSVADNMQRALASLPDQEQELSAEDLANMINGVRMTEKELLSVFERHGVQRLFPEGAPFDPNLHQAIAEVPGGNIPKGHVVNVAQSGFTISDRVLRAAMVTVSNGQ